MKGKFGVFAALSLLIAFVFNPFGTGMFALPKFVFLATFVSAVFMGIAVYCFVKGKVKIRYHSVVYGILLLWLLSLVLSTVFSIAPLTSLWGGYDRMQGLYAHLLYISVFLIFLHFLAEKKARDVFLKILVAVAFVVGIHAVVQQFGIGVFAPHAMDEFLGRSFSTFGQPNFLGQFLLFPIWATLYFFCCGKAGRKTKILYGAMTIFLILALFLTENRASILGLVMGVLFFLAFTPAIGKRLKYLLGTGVFAGFVLIVFLFMPSLRSTGTRVYLWQAAIDLFREFPLIGSGLETFRFTYQTVATPAIFNFEKLFEIPDRVHNIFLDTLVQQGLFGLLVYLGILVGLFVLFFRSRKKAEPLLLFCYCALVSILVGEFFGFPLAPHYVLTAALIAIILNICLNFKSWKLSNKYLISIFILLLATFSVFNINHAGKVLYADILAGKSDKHFMRGDFVQATNLLLKATTVNPRQDRLFYQYSEFGYDAERALESAGRFDGKSYIYHLYSGGFYTKIRSFDLAESHFSAAHSLAPYSPLVLREWGIMYFSVEDYENAIQKLERFLKVMPEVWKQKPHLEKLSFEEREQYRLFEKHVPGLDLVFLFLYESSLQIEDEDRVKYYKQFF